MRLLTGIGEAEMILPNKLVANFDYGLIEICGRLHTFIEVYFTYYDRVVEIQPMWDNSPWRVSFEGKRKPIKRIIREVGNMKPGQFRLK